MCARQRVDPNEDYSRAGQQLAEIRKQSGLTLEEVERESRALAQERNNQLYVVTKGRLSQIEASKSSLPSIYKLASLSKIYSLRYAELLRLYGIETEGAETEEEEAAQPARDKDCIPEITEIPLGLTDH